MPHGCGPCSATSSPRSAASKEAPHPRTPTKHETEAASENPDLGNDDEDEDEDDAIDELAPVDADAVIRRGEAWSDPTFPANEASLGLRDDVDEGRGPSLGAGAASRGRGAGSSSNTAASSRTRRRLLTSPKAASGTVISFRLSACWRRVRRRGI